MNALDDLGVLEQLAPAQRGVFSLADLAAALAEKHRAAFYRRVERLIAALVLARCSRGLYVSRTFDPVVLSQRLAPGSAISFEYVLARALVIGPRPIRALSAIRGGRTQTYSACGLTIRHHHLADSLRFGEEVLDGVRTTVPEKALLDVLTFHQRGRRALFDVRTDAQLDRLDRPLLREFLDRYENPRFVAFARSVLQLA